MSKEEENSIESAYNLYREAALTGENLNLEKDDIIDIFDYAGDVNDDYVRVQILQEAARRFPADDDFAKRKAVFLLSLSLPALTDFMQSKEVFPDDQFWDIMQCYIDAPSGAEAEKRLMEIVEMDDEFAEDEAIIQFIALAKHLGMVDWVIANLPRIRKSCKDATQTLLFEVARVAETRSQMEEAIKILEELTMENPFYTDYWGLLAELQSNCERYDDALMSLDYAIALSPDDGELYALKGYILVKATRYKEAVKALHTALDKRSTNYSIKRNLIEALRFIDKNEEYHLVLDQLFAAEPGDQALLLQKMSSQNEGYEEMLELYYQYNEPEEAVAIQHVSELCSDGNFAAAQTYLQWYSAKFGLSQAGKLTLLELLYMSKLYDQAYEFICREVSSLEIRPHECGILAIIASTLLRMNFFAEAKKFCDSWIDKVSVPEVKSGSNHLIYRGLLDTLKGISRMLAENPYPSQADVDRVAL